MTTCDGDIAQHVFIMTNPVQAKERAHGLRQSLYYGRIPDPSSDIAVPPGLIYEAAF